MPQHSELTFVLLQIVAFACIYAEFAHDGSRWLVIAAFGWLVAFLPWVVRSLWIFATPRIDGKPVQWPVTLASKAA
jgi:uncharacterized protein involved in response to NO